MASSRTFFTITAACASTVFAARTSAQSGRAMSPRLGVSARVAGAAAAPVALESEEATARALDQLADAAGELGDPETQLRALFQAAMLYEYLGDGSRVADRLPKIRALLKSPAISDETRKDIASRISRS